MNTRHLVDIDLNLLVVLESLLRTRSTTRTARELGRTQSAVSHALARLRTAWDDELFVREGAALRPTTRAESSAPQLVELLVQTRALVDGDRAQFDPKRLHRIFAIGATDYFEVLLLPKLLARLAREAPRVDLILRAPGDELERSLSSRDVDIGLGTRFRPLAGVLTEPISTEGMAMIARRDHPMLRRLASRGRASIRGTARTGAFPRVPLDTYVALPHALVAPRGSPGGVVDAALARVGRERRVVLTLTHFLSAAFTCERTDIVCTVPRIFATAMAQRARLSVFEIPVDVPPFQFQIAHSAERSREPALAWLRKVVKEEWQRVAGAR
jgi:DNA-binding transcriptional LysR family regulator